jgi:hypothetical protein
MKTGVGLALVAVGAILAFAVTTNTSVFNLHTAGWVLIIIGIIGIAIPRRGYGWVGRRVFTQRTRFRRGARVEEITYPTYVNRNPANTRVQAGLPPPPARWAPPRRPTTSKGHRSPVTSAPRCGPPPRRRSSRTSMTNDAGAQQATR